MSLALRSISTVGLPWLPTVSAALRPALGLIGARNVRFFATGEDPLKDPRTTSAQQRAHETDEATKDSIRHAAEGRPGEATKDIGEMAKNAARGAKESAKLMYDSVKEKVAGKTDEMKEQASEKMDQASAKAQEMKERAKP